MLVFFVLFAFITGTLFFSANPFHSSPKPNFKGINLSVSAS